MDTWTCPKCKREFFGKNQAHFCSEHTIEDILEGKAPGIILAFDALLLGVAEWEPQTIGAGKSAIIFNNGKAYMIVRALKTALDVTFFHDTLLKSPILFKSGLDPMGKNKYRHTVRLKSEADVTPELIDLVRKSYDYSMPKRVRKALEKG